MVDVADDASNKAFFEAAANHFGGDKTIDYILLNAGVEGSNDKTQVQSLDVANYDFVFGINVHIYVQSIHMVVSTKICHLRHWEVVDWPLWVY